MSLGWRAICTTATSAIDDGGSFMANLHSRLCPGAPNTEMLYNPIRPLLSQLNCVNLSGIQSGGIKPEKDSAKAASVSDVPHDVETIRLQVMNRLEDAQKLFTEPATANKGWQELERQADLSYANNDWEAAMRTYEQLLRNDEDRHDLPPEQRTLALLRRGYCYGQKGETDKAIADYSVVIDLAEASVDQIATARVNRGICYFQKGETDKAVSDYTAVVKTARSTRRAS